MFRQRERGLPGSMDSQCVYSTGPWTGAKQPGLVDERRARGGEQEDEGRRRVGGGGQRGRLTLFFMSGWNLLEGYSVYITVNQTHSLF